MTRRPGAPPEGTTTAQGGPRCSACGGRLRLSHTTYAGAGMRAGVFACAACGATEQGSPRPAAAWRARTRSAEDRSRPGRRPLDQGTVDNPVIDEATAALLRERLGGP